MAFTATATKAIPASVAVLLLLIGPGARAQQPSQDQIAAIRASCRSDFMANCSGVTPGGKDALECLKRNLAKLSGVVQNGGERDHAGPRGTRAGNGRARSCSPPRRPPATPPASSSVKPAAAPKPTPHTSGQTRALGSASSGSRGPATATAAPPTGAPEASQCDGAAAARGAAHHPHLRGRPASALRRRAADRSAE